jgi:aerobic C4-dicarboxylate transport protein
MAKAVTFAHPMSGVSPGALLKKLYVQVLLAIALGIALGALYPSPGSDLTGGGFVALAATLPAIDVLPVGGLALPPGIDRFMAEIRAVTNLFSNIFATVVVAKWVGALDPERLRVLDGDPPLREGA